VSTTFGAEDSSVFHFNTGLQGFYFNKEITVAGDIHSYNTDTILGPSDNTDTYLKVHNGSDKITAQADEFVVQGDNNYLQTKFTSGKVELHTNAGSVFVNKPLDVNGRIQDKTGFVSPVGSVIAFAGSTAPDGWLLCDGSNYSSAKFPDLHAVIGTSFGSTGGNFHVPDLRTRVPVGLSSSNTQFQEIGDVGGAAEHTLSVGEMPSHQHDVGARNDANRGMGNASVTAGGYNGMISSYSYGGDDNTYHPSDSDAYHAKPTGADSPHNNMPPFVVMNYIIKY
jgi:microcystin-dependent protein